jgi:D-galactarolactone cycloisomerase
VRATREAVGDSMEIMVDLNQGWRMPWDTSDPLPVATVRRVAAELRELGVLWLEEPLPAHDLAGLAELRTDGAPRLAGGEMVRTTHELFAAIDGGALDVLQPDAVLAVGLRRAYEVAARAHGAGLWFTPHTWTNGLGLVANLHVASAARAGPFLEFPYDPPGWTPERRDAMLAEPIRVDADGCVSCPDGPGLGVELDEARLEAHRVG